MVPVAAEVAEEVEEEVNNIFQINQKSVIYKGCAFLFHLNLNFAQSIHLYVNY